MWPTDLDYGIFGYGFTGKPMGGRIKTMPEDFRVIEVLPKTNKPLPFPPEPFDYSFDDGGLFLIGRVWRKGHDHSKMIRLIGKAFRVGEDQISTSGIKDARAEIVQLFSVYQPQKEVSDPTMLDMGMEIDNFQYSRERMYPGYMGGNYFEITIRDTEFLSKEQLDNFGTYASTEMINYFGYQRFGSQRPITAQFGRAIANRDYKKAVDIYLGGRSSRSEDEKYRKHWRLNKDPDQLLILWDDIPNIEKRMLKRLSKRNNDYRGAISKVPQFLINIGKSAFVSLLANHYFSRRGLNTDVLQGERKVKNNIEVALPSNRWPEPLNEVWEEVFDHLNVNFGKELKTIRHTTRMLKIKVSNWNSRIIDGNTAKVQFQLKNGQYATTVLRELMQQPPNFYF